jgi:hypothetical protein
MIDTNVLSGSQLSTTPTAQQILIEISAISFTLQVIQGGLTKLNQVLAPTPPPIDPQTKALILAQLQNIRTTSTTVNQLAAQTTTTLGGLIDG